jgi:diguanylate cyclase (GGDEF)-like protein
MRSRVQRHRLGDRMIVVVGTLVAVAIAALLGFSVLVANRVDQDSAKHEMELARGGLATLQMKMRQDLASLAHWDEAVDRIINKLDPTWIHRHFGARLHDNSGHDSSFILDFVGRPVYSAVDGILVDEKAYERVRLQIDPIVTEVAIAYVKDATGYARSGEMGVVEPPPEPRFKTVFRRVENRPALVGVISIVPNINRAAVRGFAPATAVSIAFFDNRLLRDLAQDLQIGNLTLFESLPSGDEQVALEILLGVDDMPAWLVWTPRKPGAAMLARLMPALFAIAALIGLVAFFVLLNLRKTTAQLAQSERRATELAFRDPLTGLANRVLLLETLGQRLVEVRTDRRLALFLIDLDNFKDINDTLGHAVGDEMLFAIGDRLTTVTGENGMVVRFGGDEFALLVSVGEGNEEISVLCHNVTECMRMPVSAGGQLLHIGVTTGVAVAPDDAHEAEQLVRRADIALYCAKAEARGAHRLFEPGYEEVLHKRSNTERELSRALANDELAVKFQPLYAADGEHIVGVEALVRWNHPERGVVPPSEFIPVAERSGLVVKIDEWVLRRACEQAREWPGLSLAVNLSPSNFRQSNVAARLTRVLADTGFDPRRLEFEITEGMLLGATPEALGELAELRRIGIRIALDDFGTGYSSLGYLRRFPVDKIKIDKSFVQNLGVTEDAAAIVECVARLGRALGLAVTAEGVETGEQHRFVRAAGCHQVQGYLFSPPVDAARIAELIEPRQRARAGERAVRLAIG